MLKRRFYLGAVFSLIIFTNLKPEKSMVREQECLQESKSTMVFVHGTLFPVLSTLVRILDCPLGLTPAHVQGNKVFMGRIPYILNKASCEEFPLECSYLFGWSGDLSFKARKYAAQELYKALNNLKGPITLIAHSHGCNVALNLAQVVDEARNPDFKIDKLILLACPVQEATAAYIKSGIFKKVFSLYSIADMIQVADPQALYPETRSLMKKQDNVPFFSQRTFMPSHNLIQARIFIDRHSPGHHCFISKKFISKLPSIIKLLEEAAEKTIHSNFMVNLPSSSHEPYLVKKKNRRRLVRVTI